MHRMVQDVEGKMEFRCEECDRTFNSEESLNQHNSSKHLVKGKKGKVNIRKYFILAIIFGIVISLTFGGYAYTKKPGAYDEFVKCLTEKGAVMYGNDYCSYTLTQIGMFRKSKKYLNYVKCADNEKLCNEKGVSITPTWEINGEILEGVQGIDKLSELSGCEI